MRLRHRLLMPYKTLKNAATLLFQQGWLRSYWAQQAVDRNGAPLPWFSYPAIEYLKTLELSQARIFEYGCGNSTRFWSSRAREIVAAENDPAWAAEVQRHALPNVRITVATDRERYARAPLDAGGVFDLISIDGRFRHACVQVAVQAISEGGLILLDNADWYPNACSFLRERGWFQIDFSGFGPINAYCTTTSVFVQTSTRVGARQPVRPTGGLPLTAELDD